MNTSSLRTLGVGLFTAGALATTAAHAATISIPVTNYSFEQSSGGSAVPGWTGGGAFIDTSWPGSTSGPLAPAQGSNYLTWAYGGARSIT